MSFDLKISGGDLVLSGGDLKTVVDSEKLIQDILKMALTPAGSNPSFPWYGSFLSRSLIGSALDTTVLLQVGQSQLQNALQILMKLQQAQVQSGQRVSADEQINSILDISISRSSSNPTSFAVKIRAISKGFKPITTAFEVNTLT